jgi:hypothetical protein
MEENLAHKALQDRFFYCDECIDDGAHKAALWEQSYATGAFHSSVQAVE